MGDRDDGILLDEAQGQEQEQDESLMDLLGLEDDSENIELMKGAAEQGKEEGILNLGIAYLHGKGVEQDFAEACYWFEQSRDAMAMVQIAEIYDKEGSKELAVEYYRRAVSAPEDRFGGFRASACINLALKLCAEDPEEADRYLRQAADLGVPEDYQQIACKLAGILGGVFAKQENLEKALEWLRFSADGCEDTGVKKQLTAVCREVLREGPGSSLYKEALEGMEHLADGGDQLAMMTVFQYWDKNTDLPQSAAKYKEWLVKAADFGVEYAQFLLVQEYLGTGRRRTDIPEDIGLARKYFDRCKVWIGTVENGGEIVARFEAAIRAKEQGASAGNKAGSEDAVPERILEQEEAEEIVERMSRTGETVLVIPEGVTGIGVRAFDSRASKKLKYTKNIESIRFPDSVREIDTWAFACMDLLKEITLPPRLKYLGKDAFSGDWVNFINLWVRDKRTFQCIEIPACTELEEDALFGIHRIMTLRFLEGRKVLDWKFLGDKTWIEEVIVPDSVEKMIPFEPSYRKIRIEKFSLPSKLKDQFQECIGKYCPKARAEFR